MPIPPLDGFQALRHLWGLITRRRPPDEQLAVEQVLVQLEAGVQAVQGGKPAEAVTAFRKVLELKPDLYGAWHNLGVIYQDKGQRYAAIAAWQGASKAAADDEQTRAEVQGRLASLGGGEDPEASYTTLLRQLPDIAPRTPAGDLITISTDTTKWRGRFKNIALWGSSAVVVGLVSFGLLVGLVVKAVGPDEYRVLVEQGLSLIQMEQIEEAEQTLQEARLRDASRVEAHLGLGIVSLAQEDCAAAVLHFQDATAAEPELALGYTFLGSAHLCQRELDQAQEALNRAKELDDQSAEVYWMFGGVHLQKYDLAAAESAFRQALELAPDDPEIRSDLAFTLYHLGDLEGALSEANTALTLDPDSASAHEVLALVYHDQGNIEAALAVAHRVVELEPQLAPALYVIGACYRDQGQVSQAIEYFRLAIERAGPMRFQQLYASRAQEELSALEK